MSIAKILLSPAVVGTVGVLLGAAGTYKFAQRKFEALADEQIEQARKFYQNRVKTDRDTAEAEVKRRADAIIAAAGYAPPVEGEDISTIMTEHGLEEWNFQTESMHRNPEVPYVIHITEFEEGEDGHEHVSVVYYEGDNILADEHDEVIPDQVRLIGQNLKFGHGSENPDLLYIRNHRLKIDIEVTRNDGSFQDLVLGQQL